MDFYDWLLEKRKLSQATASKYNLVIKNRISEWLPSYELPKNVIEFEALKELIVSLDIYQNRNKVGNNMYSSALKHYGHYLREYEESISIYDDHNNLTSEAMKMIKVRLSQNKFRKKLFDICPKCAVTGLESSKFLIGSHIKPWSKSDDNEKIDPYNGFLLTPNFDHLFDKGYITFKLNGDLCVSTKLTTYEQNFFQIPNRLVIRLSNNYAYYLQYHQDQIFQI